MQLFHYSENPNIERFTPRAPIHHPAAKPMVWAIDEWHSPLYYFPSDCPRVCFWPLPTTEQEHLDRFWLDDSLRMVIAIEAYWLPTLNTAEIYRYSLPADTFVDCKDHGVWVSSAEVEPVSVDRLGSITEELARAGVELRACPSLVPIALTIKETSLHWSLIRMKFAEGWNAEPGTPTLPIEP